MLIYDSRAARGGQALTENRSYIGKLSLVSGRMKNPFRSSIFDLRLRKTNTPLPSSIFDPEDRSEDQPKMAGKNQVPSKIACVRSHKILLQILNNSNLKKPSAILYKTNMLLLRNVHFVKQAYRTTYGSW